MAKMNNWSDFKKNVERILKSDPYDDRTSADCRELLKKGDEKENKPTMAASAVRTILEMDDFEILLLRNLDPWTGFRRVVEEYVDIGAIELTRRQMRELSYITEDEASWVWYDKRILSGYDIFFPKNLSDWKEAMEKNESEIKSSVRRLKGLPRSGMRTQKKAQPKYRTSSVSEGADPDLDSHFHEYGDFFVKFDDDDD